MIFRNATIHDIPGMQIVRNAVKENRLSDPSLVPDADYEEYIFTRGNGWVCEENGRILGFAIADLVDENIWALFVHPDFEKQGIGKKLHDMMMNWYFSENKTYCWLGTAPGTRAEAFYKTCGWKENGMHGKEVKFELTAQDWSNRPAPEIA